VKAKEIAEKMMKEIRPGWASTMEHGLNRLCKTENEIPRGCGMEHIHYGWAGKGAKVHLHDVAVAAIIHKGRTDPEELSTLEVNIDDTRGFHLGSKSSGQTGVNGDLSDREPECSQLLSLCDGLDDVETLIRRGHFRRKQ
jgi:hypothetical protein